MSKSLSPEIFAQPKGGPRARLKQAFAAFDHPNYRLWFGGQLVSFIGNGIQTAAQGYLMFEITQSSTYLGLVGFAAGLPIWLLTLYGGVLADRMSRQKILIVTQAVRMVLVFVLAALVFLNVVQPWHILVLAFLQGVTIAFNGPARQSFIPEIVGTMDLGNAIVLNATLNNLMTMIGPAIAGVVYLWVGPGWCFVLNAISFLVMMVALMFMTIKPQPAPETRGSVWGELKEGLSVITKEGVLRSLIFVTALHGVFGMSIITIFPAWAVRVLHGDVAANSWMLSARSLGAVAGLLALAFMGRDQKKGKLLTMATFVFPAILLLFTTSQWLWLSLVFLVGTGMMAIWVQNLTNTLVQMLAPDALRGRIMSAYVLISLGFAPLGALWIGVASEWFGEVPTMTINALILLVVAGLVWAFAPQVRKLA